MVLISDVSGGVMMEREGMVCSKKGVVRASCWEAVMVSDMEPYCMWAHCWGGPIVWGVCVMLVIAG